jgi:hypothetical protein
MRRVDQDCQRYAGDNPKSRYPGWDLSHCRPPPSQCPQAQRTQRSSLEKLRRFIGVLRILAHLAIGKGPPGPYRQPRPCYGQRHMSGGPSPVFCWSARRGGTRFVAWKGTPRLAVSRRAVGYGGSAPCSWAIAAPHLWPRPRILLVRATGRQSIPGLERQAGAGRLPSRRPSEMRGGRHPVSGQYWHTRSGQPPRIP